VRLAELPPEFLLIVAVLLGLLFGSFLNVVIHRLPRDQNIAFPPSTCPVCGARIRAYDNIPVLSWLILRGKARCCGARISPRYPLVELLGGLTGWAVMNQLVLSLPESTEWHFGILTFLSYFALCLGLLALLFIDLEHMLLPDALTLGGAGLGLVSFTLRPLDLTDALLGGAVGFLVVWLPFDRGYRLLRGHPGMGLGDAKLLLLAGVWFGWPGALFALMAGAVQGTIAALVVYATAGKIEEPAAVRLDREALKQELAAMNDDERAALEAELDGDLLTMEPSSGLASARLPFGPFLVLAIFQFLFLEEWLTQLFFEYFWLV
jgi:leader peptidase (prepilin peptidase)/N-methyltransferase